MKLTSKTIEHVILFLRNRHVGDVQEAGRSQIWLKSKLRKNYSTVLLKHGDPDRDDYLEVMQRWFKEERDAMKQK